MCASVLVWCGVALVDLCECFSECGSGAEESALDGAFGDGEDLGEGVVVVVLLVAEDEEGSLLGVELGEGCVEVGVSFG